MANPSTITAALARLAGTIPDGHVADQLGIPLYMVKDYRREANVPAFQRTHSAAPVAASVPDAPASASVLRRRQGSELSLRVSVPPAVDAQVVKPVSAAAKLAKPQSESAPAETGHRLDKYRARMGNEPDEVIAVEAGVHRTSVGQYRRDNNISAYRGHYEGKAKAPRAAVAVAPPVAAAAPAVADVPAAPAKVSRKKAAPEVAVAAPVAEAPVASPKPARTKAAAAAAAPEAGATPAVEVPVARKPIKLAGFESRIGIDSDSVVAKAANCSPRLVRMYREKHGIPSPVRVVSAVATPVVIAPVAPTPEPAVEVAAPRAARTPRAAVAAAVVPAPVVEPVLAAVAPAPAVESQTPKVRKPRAARSAAVQVADPIDSESASAADTSAAESEPAVVPVVAAPPAAAAVQLGFRVVAVADGVSHRFLAIGADIGAAASKAYQSLASRPGGPWRIVKIVAGDEVVG